MNLKECRLLVTPTSYGKNDSRLKTELEAQVGEVIYNPTGKPLLSNEIAQLLPGIDGYIAGLDAIDANALKTADRLKVICRYGVGVDNVDLDAAREKRDHRDQYAWCQFRFSCRTCPWFNPGISSPDPRSG